VMIFTDGNVARRTRGKQRIFSLHAFFFAIARGFC
jgi:hypothetical protein